jgi:hypothetical protein
MVETAKVLLDVALNCAATFACISSSIAGGSTADQTVGGVALCAIGGVVGISGIAAGAGAGAILSRVGLLINIAGGIRGSVK